ncbi:MAG: hypothetical protein DRR19_29420 [Candidatus Parabeggiatoa sp. nov. 1]|nr:MAG: hypothetical protein DRR19_29420 [Gammaproteobacteria bacterium]
MLKEATHIHEAEFLLSGLLEVVHNSNSSTVPNKVDYDFIPEVRDELLDAQSVTDSRKVLEKVSQYVEKHYDFIHEVRDELLDAQPVTDSRKVLEKVSQYVEEHLGEASGFAAVLANPTDNLDSIQICQLSESFAFATVATSVLKRLGGRFKKLVEKIEHELVGELFEFETVTVNDKGEIIEPRHCTGRQQVENINGVPLEMVYIPRGTFMMGSPENEKGRFKDEGPQHRVTVQPFYISKYPITQAQWQAVMGNNPSRFEGENKPVERVSWNDSIDFCQKLSELTNKTYRLPSEAEWEYACRAGTTTPFYFGQTISSDLANYDNSKWTYADGPEGIYRERTTNVDEFPPNLFSLYDMHGNVWEWCADSYHDNYQNAPNDGSIWENNRTDDRVLRGGSWANDPNLCRAANRNKRDVDHKYNSLGFRVVMVIQT